MPLRIDELAKAFELIEQTELKTTFKESWKGAKICGVTVFASSLCFGPVGAVYGGIVGGLVASAYCRFDSVSYVLKNKLKKDQQDEILALINNAIEDVTIEDTLSLFQYLKNNPQIIGKLLKYLSLFGINVSPGYEILYSKMIE